MQDKMGQDSATDLIDMMYKGSLINKTNRVDPLDQTFVEDAPGYGDLTLRQFKALPESDREYMSHVFSARQTGDEPMSKQDFDDVADKDKEPATAMGSAIAKYIRDYGKLPPPEVTAKWADMFRADPVEAKPAPVTWTTATSKLTERFSKMDRYGVFGIIDPVAHDKAQEILADFQEQSPEMSPLKAVNESNKRARDWQRKVEDKYFQYIQAAKNNEDRLEQIRSQFFDKYGYLPSRRKQ